MIYLAAPYKYNPLMRDWRTRIEGHGLRVSSRWINGDHEITGANDDAERIRFAEEDIEDLIRATTVIAYNPKEDLRIGRGGRHVELGIAIALNKRIILVGERGNVFHWLPSVRLANTIEEAIDYIITW